MFQRLRGTLRFDWWAAAAIGAVDWRAHARYVRREHRVIAFANVAQHALPVPPPPSPDEPAVHVMAGFVDLGFLAQTLVKWHRAKAPRACPIFWVGYDPSMYVCAKAQVLLQMLGQGAAEDAVLQARSWPCARAAQGHHLEHCQLFVGLSCMTAACSQQPPHAPDTLLCRHVAFLAHSWPV